MPVIKKIQQRLIQKNFTELVSLLVIWILHVPGKYADDCYRIFCCGEYETVQPNDHALLKFITWQKDKTKSVDSIRDEVEDQVKDYKEAKKLLRQKTKEREMKKALLASTENSATNNNNSSNNTQPPVDAPSNTNSNNNPQDDDVVEIPKPTPKKKVSPFFQQKKAPNKVVEIFKARTRNLLQPSPQPQTPSPPQQAPPLPSPVLREKLEVVYVSIPPIKGLSKKRAFGDVITNTAHTRKPQIASKRLAVEKSFKEYQNQNDLPTSSPPIAVTM